MTFSVQFHHVVWIQAGSNYDYGNLGIRATQTETDVSIDAIALSIHWVLWEVFSVPVDQINTT